jgi:hypothetical protein
MFMFRGGGLTKGMGWLDHLKLQVIVFLIVVAILTVIIQLQKFGFF